MLRKFIDSLIRFFWPLYLIIAALVGWSTIRENWEWVAGITVVVGIVFLILRQIDIYNDTKAILGFYKKTEDVTPDDFLITEFNENYLRRESDDLMEQELDESKYVLLKGIPMIGKTRAVYEMVKRLEKYYLIKIPIAGEVKINFKDARKIKLPLGKKRIVMVFDDLDKYVIKKDFIDFDALVNRLKERAKDFKLIATCRAGDEYKHFEGARRDLNFCKHFEVVEPQRLTQEEAAKLGALIGKDVRGVSHDNTPGSIVIDLEEMKRKYSQGRLEGYHLVLHTLRLLREGRVFWALDHLVREVARRVFQLEEKGTWFEALEWNLANGFVERWNNRITPAHDSYLDDDFLGDFEQDQTEARLSNVAEIAKGLKYVESLYDLGLGFVHVRDYDHAIGCFKSIVAFCSDLPEGHYALAHAYQDRGLVDDAVREYERALALRPDYVGARCNLGNLRYGAGLLDEAAEQYRQALKADPKCAEAHNNLGLVYIDKGMLEEAIGQINLALKLSPDDPDYHNSLGVAYCEKGMLDQGIAQYQRALRCDPQNADAYVNWGNVYARQGLLDEAVSKFKEALGVEPDHVKAHYNLGNAYREKGLLQAAIGEWEQALESKPDYASAYYNLACVYAVQGNRNESLGSLAKAIQLDPKLCQVAKTDKDFENIKNDPEFRHLVGLD